MLVFEHPYVATKESGNQYFFKSTNIRKTFFDIMLISTAYAGLFDENRTDVNMILHGQSHDFSEGPPTAKIRVTTNYFDQLFQNKLHENKQKSFEGVSR